jgi:mono/diheme cytochrome c family protein
MGRRQARSRTLAALSILAWASGCDIGALGSQRYLDGIWDDADAAPPSSHAAPEGGLWDAAVPVDSGEPASDGAVVIADLCSPARSGEAIPAREAVTSREVQVHDKAIFTQDIFSLFKSNCGGCHVDTDRGGFRVKDLSAFASATGPRQQTIHDRLHSDDPSFYMPPAGASNSKPWSERTPDDPVVQMAGMLDAWFAAGSPADLFYMPADTGDVVTDSPYLLSESVASNFTNLGNCLPYKAIVGTESSKMDELDAFFASAQQLPQKLAQTDLFTLDSETLARNGVISFAPAYPLFSDGARKARHVRVPHGQSLVFDKERQEFSIPANTRVYKTFFKPVIDKNGQERYRKIETRLIVSRPDGPDAEDGSHETHSLFGTYAWNEDETEATLVTDPLRNGQPFRDRVLTYITDEAKAEEVLATNPYNKVVALRDAAATRSYAIPGSDRCVQCHMGSHNRSFILGLTPLQLQRRATGEGGTYEETGDDELHQLQRLIDYKVITGVASPEDILPLEASQGDRAPRNDYELKAQGYMLGNCAHCHNPRGFPTTQNPVLKDLLRFFPDRDGGIFQFPLERTSPRIKRGKAQDIELAYITPSLFDLEVPSEGGIYQMKRIVDEVANKDYYLAAPWRSLIYRNVDAPFGYSEDYALYPHMPMNSSGFDCRAPGILGDWMVSIPARLLDPKQGEAHQLNDVRPQQYEEVKPSDPGYAAALREAKARLDNYHKGGRAQTNDLFGTGHGITYLSGLRYSDYCPDTSDIVDPSVGGTVLTPGDVSSLPSVLKQLGGKIDVSVRGSFASAKDGVPDHAHWVITDITDPPGDWYPRRTDWASVLVDKHLDGVDERQTKVVEMLQNVVLTGSFRSFAVTPLPFGLWEKKDGCDFAAVPKVSSLTGSTRPAWLDQLNPPAGADEPVYMQSPGSMVFHEICVNCHGPAYDSRGRQADTLLLLTGGETRVANLRDGLLGPSTDPGANRKRVFEPYASASTSADDWAARYVAWMGLGGTQRIIPATILNVVGAAAVLGKVRPNGYSATATSANMLSIAQTLCSQTLGVAPALVPFDVDTGAIAHGRESPTALIATNGDAETWLSLCAYDNPAPVRVVRYNTSSSTNFGFGPVGGLYKASSYPSSAPVGDHHGNVANGVQPDNQAPWCVVVPTDPAAAASFEALRAGGTPLPICPNEWLTDENLFSDDDLESWTLRAAMNAGMAVFLQLDKQSVDARDGKSPLPSYDQCEQLSH